jgi:GntR family transcriptional repressor for pyruvate dehydrogenase complex
MEMCQAMQLGVRKTSGSLTHQVVAHISSLIESGALVPGAKLPSESEIVRREGVSRTVVREAISKLQAAGLVATRHGIGSFIAEPMLKSGFAFQASAANTVIDLMALLEARIGIETEAAALAAHRRTEGHLLSLKSAMESFKREMRTGRDAIDPDLQFHLGVIRAAGNQYFIDIFTSLGAGIIPRLRFQIEKQPSQRQQYLERIHHEHEDIYSAILRSDPDAARAAVRNHLGNSRERMKRASTASSTTLSKKVRL